MWPLLGNKMVPGEVPRVLHTTVATQRWPESRPCLEVVLCPSVNIDNTERMRMPDSHVPWIGKQES